MTGDEMREELRKAVFEHPDTWFDVSYRLRYNRQTESFDFEDVNHQVRTRDSDLEVKK